MNQQRPLLVSLHDAATLLGVSVRTVQRLVYAGFLSSVKIRKRRLVKMAGLITFAEKGTSVDVLKRVLNSSERISRP